MYEDIYIYIFIQIKFYKNDYSSDNGLVKTLELIVYVLFL